MIYFLKCTSSDKDKVSKLKNNITKKLIKLGIRANALGLGDIFNKEYDSVDALEKSLILGLNNKYYFDLNMSHGYSFEDSYCLFHVIKRRLDDIGFSKDIKRFNILLLIFPFLSIFIMFIMNAIVKILMSFFDDVPYESVLAACLSFALVIIYFVVMCSLLSYMYINLIEETRKEKSYELTLERTKSIWLIAIVGLRKSKLLWLNVLFFVINMLFFVNYDKFPQVDEVSQTTVNNTDHTMIPFVDSDISEK